MQQIHKDRLSSIDNLLIQAIETAFYEEVEACKPQIEDGDDNGIIGEKYRAYIKGKQIIEKALINIKSYKTGGTPDKGFSKER
jgi:hypothetical protein